MTTAGRNAIVDEWLREVATPAMARFLRAPLAAIVDGVVDDDFRAASAAVNDAIRVIAVQALTASEAASFLLPLTRLLSRSATLKHCPTRRTGETRRERDRTGAAACAKVVHGVPPVTNEQRALGERVERLMPVAVERYVACRQLLGEITRNEQARRTWLLGRLRASATAAARRS
ncbi:MAG: hypothetical protein ACM3NQ_24865 [Bacteroidales bacterium]